MRGDEVLGGRTKAVAPGRRGDGLRPSLRERGVEFLEGLRVGLVEASQVAQVERLTLSALPLGEEVVEGFGVERARRRAYEMLTDRRGEADREARRNDRPRATSDTCGL